MCDCSSPSPVPESDSTAPEPAPTRRPVSRRALLSAALAGTGLAVAGSVAGPLAGSAAATSAPPLPPLPTLPTLPKGTPLRPVLPVLPSQPKGPTKGAALTLLGTAGGPQAEYVRTGTSSVLTVDGFNYVIDAGRGSVTQYLNAGLRFSHLAGMFITHLHADHLADYYNYFLLESGQPNAEQDMLQMKALPVYGPGPAGALPPQPTTGTVPTISPTDPTPGLLDLTNRLTDAYAYSYNLFLRGDGIQPITLFTGDIHEIPIPASPPASPTMTAPDNSQPFFVYSDAQVYVTAILVPHGHVFPAFAYRFDTAYGSVVFSGDTTKSDNVVRLARGADILVHEVINWDLVYAVAQATGQYDKKPDFYNHLHTAHTTTEQVAQVAHAADVPQLVLTHLIPSNPLIVPDLVWKAKCSVGYGGNVHVGNDLDRIVLVKR